MAKKSLFKSTSTVGGMTLLSRILGFVRDMVIAQNFGASAGADAFFVAFKIPNFLRRLFAEGAFAQAFVPVLAEYKTQRSEGEIKAFVGAISGTLGGVLVLVTLLGVLGAGGLIAIFAPGFYDEPEKYALATDMLRFTFPYLLFISLTAFAGAVLNTYDRFAVPAFTPVLLNLSLIGMALGIAPLLDVPIMALAWGVLLAGIVQLLFQIPYLYALGLLTWPTWGWRDSGVRRVMKLMIPAIFGSSVAQINLLLDTVIASFLVTGSVSWLYYSDRLVEFPLGVLGIALATVILPSLSKKHAAESTQAFSDTIDWALRWVVIIATPAALGLFMLSGPMLTTLFQYGEFSTHDVRMAGYSLMAYSLGLLGFIFVKVLVPGFYARQDVMTPVRIGIVAMVANMVLNLLFVVPMVMTDFVAPHMGLALATAASAFLNAGLLYYLLRKRSVYMPKQGWGRLVAQVVFAGALMVVVLWWGASDMNQWFAWSAWERIMKLFLWIGVGAVSYFSALYLVGLRVNQLKALMKQH